MAMQMRLLDDWELKRERREVPANGLVILAIDGVFYRLDMTREHAEMLGKQIGEWVEVATKLGPVPKGLPVFDSVPKGEEILNVLPSSLANAATAVAPPASPEDRAWYEGPENANVRAAIKSWCKNSKDPRLVQYRNRTGKLPLWLAQEFREANPDLAGGGKA